MTHRFLAGVGAASLTAAALSGAFQTSPAAAHASTPGPAPALTAHTLKSDGLGPNQQRHRAARTAHPRSR